MTDSSGRDDSRRAEELVELLAELEKRRGLSVQQVIGILAGGFLLVFIVGPIAIILFGTIFGPIAGSVFIAMLLMFIYEGMRSSNLKKPRRVQTEEEEVMIGEQESLAKFEDETPERP